MALYFHSPTTSKGSQSSEETDATTKSREFLKNLPNSHLCPFDSFGINTNVPLINLTTRNRSMIAYGCSHMIMLYNYETKETLPLQGHQNTVKTLSVSQNGKWLMSADFEEDCAVVVWDTETGAPICTLFNPHGKDELTAARISSNAKYVVTVGNAHRPVINFWLWSSGKDEPDKVFVQFVESIRVTKSVLGPVKEVAFKEERCEQFTLTTDQQVLFFTWGHDKLRYDYTKVIENVRGLGTFNCSCYASRVQRVFTATTNGFIIVWKDDEEKLTDESEEKRHIKCAQLQKCNITLLLYNQGMVITGNSKGRINFYDDQLRILYWCQNPNFDIIRSISFDLQTGLLAPKTDTDESELEFGDEFEDEGEHGTVFERIARHERFCSIPNSKEVPSKLTVNLEPRFRNFNKQQYLKNAARVPSDASLQRRPVSIRNFFICTAAGIVALIEISNLKCHFIFQSVRGSITSLDAHPESNYLVIGTSCGTVSLYNYQERISIVSRRIPALPDFNLILESQVTNNEIVYVTCPQSDENLTAVTVLKYSPRCDLLVCGTENGALWMLHPVTLELTDNIPYKHSEGAILKLAFTKCAEYMAYSDNSWLVAVFKRSSTEKGNLWSFLGKYRSHCLPVVEIIFGPPAVNTTTPRFFSLAEDKDLIEYNLENSGPYPEPGLKILQVDRIECNAIPLSLAWYPHLGIETFLIISNSEYKYRLLNDTMKTIRGTFLGPLFGSPVHQIKMLPAGEENRNKYMIFATEKEIGLQLLPLDGSPYKITGMIGHPRKIKQMATSYDGRVLFTSGEDDPCVLIWKIKPRSVDVLARLGGDALSPFYCLIEGGKGGWLIKEMEDLFYYAQILHQGEDTVATRVISDKVSTKQIPNLMRAIGYYPSNEELEIIMGEISYRNYAETGQLLEEMTFEDFAKLYINHRPAFGLSRGEMKKAFQAFVPRGKETETEGNPILTRAEFMDVLFGRGPAGFPNERNKLFGEPFTFEEAQLYLRLLVPGAKDLGELHAQDGERELSLTDFSFLPEEISYKDFTTDMMGIELPEESRADDAQLLRRSPALPGR